MTVASAGMSAVEVETARMVPVEESKVTVAVGWTSFPSKSRTDLITVTVIVLCPRNDLMFTENLELSVEALWYLPVSLSEAYR